MLRMTITHCDNCAAVIERRADSIAISRGFMFRGIELCASCGAPAAQLLDRVAAKRDTKGQSQA
jgi:hypothetical protein